MSMNTPIYDFVTNYNSQGISRMHMPGHKGCDTLLNTEHLDITEIDGADNLWHPDGIIADSMQNASDIFGCKTFYSTEGSSLSIRAMLFLVKKWAKVNDRSTRILSTRNAHKTLINTAALLDLEIDWIMPKESDSYQVCSFDSIDADDFLCRYSSDSMPAALYLTSPDYLGNMTDIGSIAKICHKHNVLLIVDNAHGAYLKFMTPSLHPMDLGADMCCDSAHKTLPVLTGGAYLHISNYADPFFAENALSALSLFASTSPSYLIMQSLDLCNIYLYENASDFSVTSEKVTMLKSQLSAYGYTLTGDEPLKITIDAKAFGYTGSELYTYLTDRKIVTEYYDDDYIVFMISTCTTDEELEGLKTSLCTVPQRESLKPSETLASNKRLDVPEQVISYSDAILKEYEIIPSKDAIGRVLAQPVVSTPPCVPLFMCGERITSMPFVDEVCVIKDIK